MKLAQVAIVGQRHCAAVLQTEEDFASGGTRCSGLARPRGPVPSLMAPVPSGHSCLSGGRVQRERDFRPVLCHLAWAGRSDAQSLWWNFPPLP